MNHQGGVILFDCERRYKQVLPVGSQFSSFDQENEPQRIYNILEGITPKVQVGVNIEITLVPVVENPLKLAPKVDEIVTKEFPTYK